MNISAPGLDQRRGLRSMVMDIWVIYFKVNSLTNCATISFSRKTKLDGVLQSPEIILRMLQVLNNIYKFVIYLVGAKQI
jgi:hypothetical protein